MPVIDSKGTNIALSEVAVSVKKTGRTIAVLAFCHTS
jgi:hypothetical protein